LGVKDLGSILSIKFFTPKKFSEKYRNGEPAIFLESQKNYLKICGGSFIKLYFLKCSSELFYINSVEIPFFS
jgi:hypothetical protein